MSDLSVVRIQSSDERFNAALDNRIRQIVREEIQKTFTPSAEIGKPGWGEVFFDELMANFMKAASEAFAQDEPPQEPN